MKLLKKENVQRREALREVVYRRRYLVPNLVTLGNMFCGYLAIFYSATGRFQQALLTIAIAILLDGLDGRVARKLSATSEFGMEFDSFSDVVSFGVAPAVLMYHWGLQSVADDFGIFITFAYLLCAASRLARFNLAPSNLAGFTGLPTPGAAGAVISLIYLCLDTPDGTLKTVLSSLTMATLALLMVSSIEFFSIKMIKMRKGINAGMLALGCTIALVWYSPKVGFFTIAMLYCLSGPLRVAKYISRPRAVVPQN